MEPLMTTDDVAEYLRLEVATVRRLITRGELPAYRIGGEYRFIGQDLESYVRSQSTGSEDTFSKFTERCRKVFTFANEEANKLGHSYIGTEHLLLGLLLEGEGVAVLALVRAGLDLKAVRVRVLEIIEKGTQHAAEGPGAQLKMALRGALGKVAEADSVFSGEGALTRRARKVIDLSVDEARRLKHRYVGTEHLLLGILREGEGVAAQVLITDYALHLDAVRSLIQHILQESATTSGAPLPPVPAQASTLIAERMGIECGRCGAHSPEYFRYCFHCGLKLPASS